MRFKGRAVMRSAPDFALDAELDPIAFSAAATGSLFGHVGEISAVVSDIPIRLSIPFLRGRGHLLSVGSIGSMTFTIRPLQMTIERAGVETTGVLGVKGLRGRASGKIGCETEMTVSGVASGRAGAAGQRPEDHGDCCGTAHEHGHTHGHDPDHSHSFDPRHHEGV
jgi:hypothetical protein